MRTLALLAAFLLLAGCLRTPADVETPAPTDDPVGFGPAGAAVERCRSARCYEPNIAADPQGRLFVVDGSTSAVGVSFDNGSTWTQRAPPPMPGGLSGIQSDVLVQVAPTGRLYWSALVIVNANGAGFVLEGIQVAWSDDAAANWIGNVHVSPRTLTPQVLSPDRQWLGFASDGTVYLTYNQIPSGIWFARSGDEGKTWTAWTRVAPLEGRVGGIGQSGPPVVDSKGRVYVPACEGATGATLVFASDNKGQTWTKATVPGGCSWFPILAVGADDAVVLAVVPGDVLVSVSTDRGATFSPLKPWGRSGTAGAWPVLTSGGELVLAWYSQSGGTATLHVSRGVADGTPSRDQTVATVPGGTGARTPALTDFASFALLGDGRVAVVYVSENQALVTIGTP